MNKTLIYRRIDLAGSTTGSVMSVATWCALHAANAQVIVECICDRMITPSTTLQTRRNLLFVIHELLLTCLTRGVTDNGRSNIVLAVSKFFLRALTLLHSNSKQILEQQEGVNMFQFILTVHKVLTWWSVLHLFPEAWVNAVRRLLTQLQNSLGGDANIRQTNKIEDENNADHSSETKMFKLITELSVLLSRYHDAKEELLYVKKLKHEESNVKLEGEQENDSHKMAEQHTKQEVELQRILHSIINSIRTSITSGDMCSNEALLHWCDTEEQQWESSQLRDLRSLRETDSDERLYNNNNNNNNTSERRAAHHETSKRERDGNADVVGSKTTVITKNELLNNERGNMSNCITERDDRSSVNRTFGYAAIGNNNMDSSNQSATSKRADMKEWNVTDMTPVQNAKNEQNKVDKQTHKKNEKESGKEEEDAHEEEEEEEDVLASFY